MPLNTVGRHTSLASNNLFNGHHDSRSCLQVQAENIQQAEALVKLVEKVEGLNTEVQDTQQLIGASAWYAKAISCNTCLAPCSLSREGKLFS